MTRLSKRPFMSIVVLAYNAAGTVGRALDSLLAQDYPRDRYEIIVVNDGSTDNTAQILAGYGEQIRVITSPHNKGIPYGRNAGLEAARGDVYVGFDGDCEADSDWLSELAKGYELPAVAGVGGRIVPRDDIRTKGLATHYIEATGSGTTRGDDAAAPAFLPPLLRRMVAYMTSGLSWSGNSRKRHGHTEVAELFGANSSFPMDVLRAVGGWDPSTAAPAIGGIEDRDVCERIRAAYPKRHFYAMYAARLRHDPTISLRNYLLRPFRRGPFNYSFYRRNGMTPPLFPFPPFVLLLWLLSAVLAPLALPWMVLLLPQLCYFWWIQRGVVERRALYLLFPYLQLAEETMVLVGLLRGFIVHNGK